MIKRACIYNKYGGKCAYCGCKLESDWQIDHITPKKHYEWNLVNGNPNDINNLAPACRKCNHYKRCMPLETSGHIVGFRDYMLTFHKRLGKLPKNTRVKRTEARIIYMKDIAMRYGISPSVAFTGNFYFETVT